MATPKLANKENAPPPAPANDSSASVATFSSETLKKHLDAVKRAIEKKNQANADVKSALEAAEKAGVPKDELKFIANDKTTKYSDDFKATVNIMQEMLGQRPLFSFMEKPEHSLIHRH